jgi:hypothetical protein
MSYSERDGQVILTMSREDWQYLLFLLGEAASKTHLRNYVTEFVNRLNSGNPNYTPYQVEDRNETDG